MRFSGCIWLQFIIPYAVSQSSSSSNSTSLPSTFQNPPIWEDLPDNDVFRVNNTYYYLASSQHFSPGAPILQSYDLINWQYAGHAVPTLSFGPPAYSLIGGRAYGRGVWASSLRYRPQNKTFYWVGCVDGNATWIYTSPSVQGPWTSHSPLTTCLYDTGLLIDDDGTMYAAYGSTNISVAQFSPDGLSVNKTQTVITSPSNVGYVEGSRFYKYKGNYYILTDRPLAGEFVWKSTKGVWGPYTVQPLVMKAQSPIGNSSSPYQGSLVETTQGSWYYMAFVNAYPAGRIPVLAPVTWTSDGWPTVQLINNNMSWGTTYSYPSVSPPPNAPTNLNYTEFDTFRGQNLTQSFEWNHNPNNSAWSVDSSGIHLNTATVTNDLYQAQNTLTHRVLGPNSTAYALLDYSHLGRGDRAGLVLLRDNSAWVGLINDTTQTEVAMVRNVTISPPTWATTNLGKVVTTTKLKSASSSKNSNRPGNWIWLSAAGNFESNGSMTASFWYSLNGDSYTKIGDTISMATDPTFDVGYRFGVFHYSTNSTAGSVILRSFNVTHG